MREARKGDLAIIIGNYHDGGIVGQVVEVVSDPAHQEALWCHGCPEFHWPHGLCNLVVWREVRGWVPTRWLVPLPALDVERERDAEREIVA